MNKSNTPTRRLKYRRTRTFRNGLTVVVNHNKSKRLMDVFLAEAERFLGGEK